MKYTLLVAALASLASATPAVPSESPLAVTLKVINNTYVAALVVNNGPLDRKLFRMGTFLDESNVEKVNIAQAGEQVKFRGLHISPNTANLPESAFQILPARGSASASFDLAPIYDLTSGGEYEIVANGTFSYAELDSNTIVGTIPFTSNIVSTAIDGEEAARTHHDFRQDLIRRTTVTSDCTDSKHDIVMSSMKWCHKLAGLSADTAINNAAKLKKYFKSTSPETAKAVSTVFQTIAKECAIGSTQVNSTMYCSNIHKGCPKGFIASTFSDIGLMSLCSGFFADNKRSRTCQDAGRASVLIHEMSHITKIKGTTDKGGYGMRSIVNLTTAESLNHADSYAFFAKSAYNDNFGEYC